MREKLGAVDKEKVVCLYDSGMTQHQVGKAVGVSLTTISIFMKEHNIKVREKVNPDKEKMATKVADLYNSGMTQKQIGEALGVKSGAISYIMRKHNIQARVEGRKKSSSTTTSKKEVSQIVDSVNIGYKPMQFEKKRTQISNELNLYIPEMWNWRSHE